MDKNHPSATTAANGCSAAATPCINITEGLKAAGELSDTEIIPTVLVTSGTYDSEPSYPIEIDVTVTLKSDTRHAAIILNSEEDLSAIKIISPGVTIEGFSIIGEYAIEVVAGGSVTINENEIDAYYFGVMVAEGGSATLNENNISVASDTFFRSGVMVAEGGSVTLNGNNINGLVGLSTWNGGSATLNGNNIDCLVGVFGNGGSVTLNGNNINGGAGLVVANGGSVYLFDNTIEVANPEDEDKGVALFVEGGSAYISENQFGVTPVSNVAMKCTAMNEIQSDGTNTMLDPRHRIDCPGFPSNPGSSPF